MAEGKTVIDLRSVKQWFVLLDSDDPENVTVKFDNFVTPSIALKLDKKKAIHIAKAIAEAATVFAPGKGGCVIGLAF